MLPPSCVELCRAGVEVDSLAGLVERVVSAPGWAARIRGVADDEREIDAGDRVGRGHLEGIDRRLRHVDVGCVDRGRVGLGVGGRRAVPDELPAGCRGAGEEHQQHDNATR